MTININTTLFINSMNTDINLYSLRGGNGTHYIMPYVLAGIDKLMMFMKLVIYSNAGFYIARNQLQSTRIPIISSLGLHITRLRAYSELYSREYHFSPLLDFFFEQYRIHPIGGCLSLDEFDTSDIDMFSNFISTMRTNARDVKLKRKVSDWESKSQKNQKSLMALETKLFKENADLMVIQLDFKYHKAKFTEAEINELLNRNGMLKERDLSTYWAGDDLLGKRVMEGRIALEEVQRDRKHLFGNMKGKPSLFEHLVGYVWRIECGREAGYHLHVMFFFDGSYGHKYEYLAQEIGEYWRDVITKGRGYFENCNRKKKKYGDSWALGTINRWEVTRREKLREAMTHFCKTNQIVQIIPYKGCNLFASVLIRRNRGQKTAIGRPRTRVPEVANHASLP